VGQQSGKRGTTERRQRDKRDNLGTSGTIEGKRGTTTRARRSWREEGRAEVSFFFRNTGRLESKRMGFQTRNNFCRIAHRGIFILMPSFFLISPSSPFSLLPSPFSLLPPSLLPPTTAPYPFSSPDLPLRT
jgi:hypothetical protein